MAPDVIRPATSSRRDGPLIGGIPRRKRSSDGRARETDPAARAASSGLCHARPRRAAMPIAPGDRPSCELRSPPGNVRRCIWGRPAAGKGRLHCASPTAAPAALRPIAALRARRSWDCWRRRDRSRRPSREPRGQPGLGPHGTNEDAGRPPGEENRSRYGSSDSAGFSAPRRWRGTDRPRRRPRPRPARVSARLARAPTRPPGRRVAGVYAWAARWIAARTRT